MKKLILALIAGALFGVNARAQSVDTLITSGLFEPYAVAVDTNNNYYITDSANNSIVKYTPDTGQITNFSGRVSITRDFADGPSYLAKFGSPQGIVFARGGFVVADSGNNRIRFVSMDGTVSTLAGTGAVGTNDSPNGLLAQFNTPTGLAADGAGNIYIADLGSSSIRKLTINNAVVTLAGSSDLYHPSAVAVAGDGRIFVADTGNNSIKVFREGQPLSLLAGPNSRFETGLRDSLLASEALFKEPRGLLYLGGTNDVLYISDSGNQVLRRIYNNPVVQGYSVDTIQSTVGAGLSTPIGLAKDVNADILIVDLSKSQLRRIVSSQKQEVISDPQIGTAELVTDPDSGSVQLVFTPIASSIFNNDVVVAIASEHGTETFFTLDGTDPSSSNGSTPPTFATNDLVLPTTIISSSQVNAPSDVTVRAISIAAGRRSSTVVTARFQFQVANPVVIGNNAAAVSITCATRDAIIYYTTDGSDPTQKNSKLYTLGSQLDITNGTNDVTLKVRAFHNGYAASRAVSQLFRFQNIQNSTIGISTNFFAGIGSTLIVPVDVQLLPTDILHSLQFRVEVTPLNGAPTLPTPIQVLPIDPSIDFIPLPAPIPATNFTASNPFRSTYLAGAASELLFGYLGTNSLFTASNSMTVAMLAVSMPLTAVEGQQYKIELLYPSGTSDGFETPVVLKPLSAQTITVSNISYVVGDSALSTWYNAGDFGNGNLNNNDVNNAFYASLVIRVPYTGSDIFNAMDVDRSTLITLNDWNTIFFRSLRRDLNNVSRSWSVGGNLIDTPTTLNSSPDLPAESLGPTLAWSPDGTLEAGTVENVAPEGIVSVPLTLKVNAGVTMSGFQFLATVFPENGAPPVTGPVAIQMAGTLPGPTFSASKFAGAGFGWPAGTFSPPLEGTVAFGQLRFSVPAGAKAGQSYTVRLSVVQANDIRYETLSRLFTLQSLPARVWIGTSAQTPPDVLSDEWKLKFFGSLTNRLADLFADPDGDGKNNLQEFLAGTNPTEHQIQPLDSEWLHARSNGFKIRWFAQGDRTYIVESSPDMITWTEVARVTGADNLKEVIDSQTQGDHKFYRINVAP
jgi:sugar lactone lactonase YvrE